MKSKNPARATEATESQDVGANELIDTGIDGLDIILKGGLPPNRLYLVEGDPGSGKTTLALQFLMAGARSGKRSLHVTLSETKRELEATALSHGWSLEGIDVVELMPSDDSLEPDTRYTMFHPSEVELTETTRRILSEAERICPARVVFDSLSEFRLLAQNPLRYRRQILALKQFFGRRECTALLVDDRSGSEADEHLFSIAHGVISLDRSSPEYGPMRRRLQVSKLRGRSFAEGLHDFRIRRGGLEVYPRVVAAEHRTTHDRGAVQSGVPELDVLLGGGLSRGTSTLLLGPAGTGKSALTTQYAIAAAARGERTFMFLFDELLGTFLERAAGLGMDVRPLIESGMLRLQQLDPAEVSSGEFAHLVRGAVTREGARIVVIDSLNGYLNAMANEKLLLVHLHEVLAFLGQQGTTTILVLAQHGLVGSGAETPVDTSYLADTVVLLRYFEARGEIRKAISVIKKRTGRHERTIRELQFTSHGLEVGPALKDYQGVLTGNPQFVAHAAQS